VSVCHFVRYHFVRSPFSQADSDVCRASSSTNITAAMRLDNFEGCCIVLQELNDTKRSSSSDLLYSASANFFSWFFQHKSILSSRKPNDLYNTVESLIGRRGSYCYGLSPHRGCLIILLLGYFLTTTLTLILTTKRTSWHLS